MKTYCACNIENSTQNDASLCCYSITILCIMSALIDLKSIGLGLCADLWIITWTW